MLNRVFVIMLLAGCLYAGRATTLRYYQIHQSAERSGTIDWYLKPSHVPSGDALRAAVLRAGWSPDDDILVLAAASSMSRLEVEPVYSSISYLLYPAHVWVGAWCDPAASAAQCEAWGAEPAAAAVARRGVRRVLLIGETNPFPGAEIRHISDLLAAVSLF